MMNLTYADYLWRERMQQVRDETHVRMIEDATDTILVVLAMLLIVAAVC